MEITYDTGAKVILQGPCTYEVDSDRSGYLAVGRLTARVEKGSGIRDQGSGAIHPSAFSLQPSAFSLQPSALFAVRTPTAVVTDLGTEFGVEVEESGATRSHVFQGSVELVASGQWSVVSDGDSRRRATSGKKSLEILHAGQSACVERGRNNKVAIIREPGRPERFVRQIGERERGEGRGESVANHQSSNPQSLIPNPFFRLTDLGTLGGRMSRAMAINAAGQVVGEAATITGVMHAFLFTDGMMKDLGTLGDGQSGANSINTLGQVVGGSSVSKTERHAFLYHNGVMKDLGTLGGSSACAFAINDTGQIVGVSRNAKGVDRAFLCVADQAMRDLGALGGLGQEVRHTASIILDRWSATPPPKAVQSMPSFTQAPPE